MQREFHRDTFDTNQLENHNSIFDKNDYALKLILPGNALILLMNRMIELTYCPIMTFFFLFRSTFPSVVSRS